MQDGRKRAAQNLSPPYGKAPFAPAFFFFVLSPRSGRRKAHPRGETAVCVVGAAAPWQPVSRTLLSAASRGPHPALRATFPVRGEGYAGDRICSLFTVLCSPFSVLRSLFTVHCSLFTVHFLPRRRRLSRRGISFTPQSAAAVRGSFAAETRAHSRSNCARPRAKSRSRFSVISLAPFAFSCAPVYARSCKAVKTVR